MNALIVAGPRVPAGKLHLRMGRCRALCMAPVLLTVALCTTGCSELRTKLKVDETASLGITHTFVYSKDTDANHYKKQYDNSSDKKATRNAILFELMGIVDEDFGHFAQTLRADRAYKDIIFNIVSLGLTGTASLSGKGAANTLAAIDTGFKGANSAIDVNAFRNNTPELLINKMEADRSAVAAEIYKSMSSDVDVYPLQAGIRDIEKYFNQGNVTSALVSLSLSTAAEAKTASNEAVTAKGTFLSNRGLLPPAPPPAPSPGPVAPTPPNTDNVAPNTTKPNQPDAPPKK